MKYPTLPVMQCDPNCGECCGPAMCRESEFAKIVDFIQASGITPQRQGLTCPLYQNGTCQVYEVRPMICRAFGHLEQMKCSRGYNVNAPSRQTREIHSYFDTLHREGAKYLHELLEDGLAYLLSEMKP